LGVFGAGSLCAPWQPFDPEATGVRAMVNAAILRGASTSTPPEDPPPNYNTMTDAELRRHIEETHGYSPGF
jgi:hypothetical protein